MCCNKLIAQNSCFYVVTLPSVHKSLQIPESSHLPCFVTVSLGGILRPRKKRLDQRPWTTLIFFLERFFAGSSFNFSSGKWIFCGFTKNNRQKQRKIYCMQARSQLSRNCWFQWPMPGQMISLSNSLRSFWAIPIDFLLIH